MTAVWKLTYNYDPPTKLSHNKITLACEELDFPGH